MVLPSIRHPVGWPSCPSLCCRCSLCLFRGAQISVLWMGVPETTWIDDLRYYIEGSPRFDYLAVIPNVLKLPWSVQDCCDRVSPKGAASLESKKLFSRHGLLQLALWATPPFYGAPDGYMYDAPEKTPSHQRQPQHPHPRPLHGCPQRAELLDALAEALLDYEAQCLLLYQSPADVRRAWVLDGLQRVNLLLDVLERLSRKNYAPERPALQNQRGRIGKTTAYLRDMVSALTEEDFRRAGFVVSPSTNNKSHTTMKMLLISNLHDALNAFPPRGFKSMATYRSIAAMLNALQIRNNHGGDFTARGVSQILKRCNDPQFFDARLAGNIVTKTIFSRGARMGTRITESPALFEQPVPIESV